MKRIFTTYLTTLPLILFFGLNWTTTNAQWMTEPSMTTARAQFGAVATQTHIYAINGYNPSLLSNLEIFDKNTNTWSAGTPPPFSNRGLTTATCDNGLIYALGGTGGGIFYSYNPATMIWAPIANPGGSQRWESSAATGCQDQIHLMGGESSLTSHSIYNTLSNTWSSGPAIPIGVQQHSAVAIDDNIYVIGGRTSSGGLPITDVQIFNTTSNTWSVGASLPAGRNQFGCTVGVDGKIYVIGGKDNYTNWSGNIFSDVFIYDPVADSWTTSLNPLPLPLGALEAVSCGVKIYALGGWSTGGSSNVQNGMYSLMLAGQYPDCPSSYASLGGLTVPSGQTWIFDTDAMTYNGNPGGVLDKGSVVYTFDNVTVEVGATIRAIGTHPISILSINDIIVDGTIDLDGESSGDFYSGITVAGAGGFSGGMAGGPGAGPGGGGSAIAPAGGGGGGHGGTGGRGGEATFDPGVPGLGGIAYGDLTVSFCGGGSGGASGTTTPTTGGAGGGGIFLGAESNINISGTGIVTANGGAGGLSGQGASGGASGGAVILDAPSVTNDGSVSAAGGNGGLGGCCGDGGGGGGGRVYFATTPIGGGTVNVAGGIKVGPTNAEDGQPGVLTIEDTSLFCCEILISCPAAVDYGTECNVTIPAAATTYNVNVPTNPDLPTVSGTFECLDGFLELSSFQDTTDVGCQRTITRYYVITEIIPDVGEGPSDTCEQEFTFVFDTSAPTWDRTAGPLPMDMEVDCRDVPPAATLMAMDNCTGGAAPINVWINEFHYDNAGGDVGEFIEVAGLSGTDLLNYSLVLYNGSNGTVYNTIGLTGIIDDEGECIGAIDFQLPTNGLQNGSPDGIALVDPMGTVLEFISYEGTFTAVGGPADGILSTDVGVAESGSTMIGFSLQKAGMGQNGPAFMWLGPAAASPGDLNTSQIISPSACDISMLVVDFEENIEPGDCDGEYTVIRNWSTIDDCGNDTMWTQTLTVIDTVAPVACEPIPNDTTIDCTMDMIPVVSISGIDECDRSFAGPVWINEIHYDNTGADAMEFVEIAGFNGVDVTGWRIVLYNGSNGLVYNDMMLTGSFASQACGFGFIHVDYPSNGIQNGSPDGIALVDNGGNVVQFLSYEGTFTANNGPAIGMLSTDIGVRESGSTPLNFSLQLSGTGTTYSDFTWMAPTMETSSAINNGQFIQGNIVAQPVDRTVPGTCPVIDSTFRTWVLTDDCGNQTTVMQTIIRQDTTAPVLTCVGAFEVSLDENGEYQLDYTELLSEITDDCSTAFTYGISPNDGLVTCSDIGVVLVTLSGTDECGNTGTCTVEVTVVDDIPPTLICPGDLIVHLGPDECDKVVDWQDPYAFDNCELMLETGMLQSTFNSNNQFAGNMFDLNNVSTGPITINSFDGNVNAGAGQNATFEVWYRTGSYVTGQTSSAGWTLMGTANTITAGINQPTPVPIGGLTIQPGEIYGIYFVMTSYPSPGSLRYTNGNNIYDNGELRLTAGVGKGTPKFTGGTFVGRTWNGNIHYSKVVGSPPIVERIDNNGYNNGDLFPIGEYCFEYMATDNSGNTSTCGWCITVENYPNEITTLQCNNNIQLSLDGTCMIDLNADMILEGGPYGCADGYDVVVTDDRGNVQDLDNDASNGTQLGWDHVGHCYRVTVYDPDNGNSCWGTVCIEDKMRPTVQSCEDYTVSCGSNTDPSCFGGSVPCPVVIDNCDPFVQSSYVDWETYGSCSQGFDRQIQRRWTFTDQYGNTNSCEQTITVELGNLFDVAVPGNYDDVENAALLCDEKYDEAKEVSAHIRDFPFCVDGYLLDSAIWYATGGDPNIADADARDLSGDRLPMTLGWNCIESGPYAGHPSPRGEYYDPHPQWEFFGVCWGPNEIVKWQGTGYPQPADCGNIQYTYRDTKINLSDPDCNAGEVGCYKVLRQWTVIDWCTGEVGGHDQIIKILDDEGPEIVVPDVLEVGTDAWKCEGVVPIPAPWIKDNCSEDVDYDVVIKTGQVLGNSQTGYTVVGLALGEHTLYFQAYDCCGNRGLDSMILQVVDNTPPVCISEDRVQLSLTGNQTPGTNYSSICAVDLDQASYDNCTQWVWFKTIRMDELLGTVNGSFADNTAGCGGVNGDDDAVISGNQVYFDDCAKFCCEDADQIIMVVLRVHDVDPGVGPVNPSRYTPPSGNLVGRFTDCWVEVDVRDKAQPIVVAPPDIVVSCMFWFDDSEDALSDPNNATFGRVVTGLNDREKVKTIDIVCEQWCEDHPKYDYEPSRNRPAIWSQACDYYNAYYDAAHPDDKYELVWGFDGYVLRTCGATPEIRVDDRRECGQGVILRDILVTYQDPKTGGVVSYRDRQEIWVIDCDPFYVTEDCFDDDDCVEWPRFCQQPNPLDGCGANLDPYTNPDLGYPVIVNGCDDNCALVAVDYDDEVYTIEDTACFKVIRTWIIIDWCQYDPLATKTYDGDNPNEVTAGRWEFVQSIVVRDKIDPVITVDVGDCEPAVKDTADGICYGHIEICADATDDCSPDTWLVYDYKIDAFSDGVGQFGDFDFYVGKLTQDQAAKGQVLSQGPTDCIAYNQGGYCNPFADDPTQPFCASGTYPVGLHTIYWFVEDGCGNVMKQVDTFEVLDCKAPTPYCKAGIITVVMPSTQSIDIWASDLDDGSFDNCTEQEDLIFSFSSDTSETSRTFDCDDLGTIGVEIWVTDEEGNQAFCLTFVRIQDNNDVCGTTMNVAGNVENALMKERVEDVDIFVNGQMLMTTDASGQYTFPITPGTDIEIAPYKNDDPMNGISTGDVVAIQRHLLGKDEFISGYQMIAADINNNANVTAADISALRQLILGRFMDFTQWNGQTSWRFIDRDENLTDNIDPWPFTETRAQNDVQVNMFDENFDGVKIGDLNGDASNSSLTGNSTRGNGNVLMVVEDADLSAGSTYTMEVTSDNFTGVSGYQFTMKYDQTALAFTGVESGALVIDGSHVGTTSIADGMITMSWNDASGEAVSVASGEVLYSVTFEVLSNSKASEAISMNSLMTRAEAYDAHIEVMGLDLEFRNGAEAVEVFELYQNVPNPFEGKTIVGYTLPREMAAVLTVYDVSGRVLLVKDLSGSKGYNETAISRSELNSAGVLYYQLDAADYTATKRMVLID